MQESSISESIQDPPPSPTESTMEESIGLSVGQRVHASGDPRRIGTVRYVGALEGHSGIWIGVDWDNGEGKHDGSVNGVKYFEACGERSGSFMRSKKSLCSGVGFLDAFKLRYLGDYTKEEEDEMYVFSTRKNRVSIQLVGKDKIQEKLNHSQELTSVSISYMGVSSTGRLHEIYTAVPNLKELNMAGNLLSNWQDVGAICVTLPLLEILDLTGSRIEQAMIDLPLLMNIRILVLNNCRISWKEVEILKKSIPMVEELHLEANKLKTIMDFSSNSTANYITGFDSLKLLNLEDNYIDSWDEIFKLCQLKRLEHIYLNKNKLKHIFYSPCTQILNIPKDNEYQENCTKPFKNLRCLLLGSNEIEDLASIDSLNYFPNLVDVRVSDNPICDAAKGGIPRFSLIARLSKVDMLNGSEVSKRERKESEIRYVRLILSKLHVYNQEEIKQLHPRYDELKLLHGLDDEKPSVGETGPKKMASGLLSITLKCVGASFGEKPSLTKKLPSTTMVGKLKVLCESFFKLKAVKPKLFVEEECSPFPSLLDDDMSSLADLGICSGTTILVDEEA